jgi:glycosyltransferase involved in cell wall biosynthesis
MLTIDILIPTANSAKTIHSCLSSIVLASAFSHNIIRVLIADGASTDPTLETISSFTQSLDISIVSYKDNGPEDALNKLFYASTADFIMPLGSDDLISPNYFNCTGKVTPNIPILHFPRFYTNINLHSDEHVDSYLRKTRMGFWLRYANPGFGFGWIGPRKLILSMLEAHNRTFFSTDRVTYATDSELFIFLLANKFKFSTTLLSNSIFFYGSNGRSSLNSLAGCRESCMLFASSCGFISFDIYIFYFLYLLKLRLH